MAKNPKLLKDKTTMGDVFRDNARRSIKQVSRKSKRQLAIYDKTKKNKFGVYSDLNKIRQALMWIGSKAFIDNPIVRGLEKTFQSLSEKEQGALEKEAGAIPAFNVAKKTLSRAPTASAYLLYWGMWYMALFGGMQKPNINIRDGIRSLKERMSARNQATEFNTYGEFAAQIESLIPTLIGVLILPEGIKTNSAGLHVPYLCAANVWTIGFGSTLLPDNRRVSRNTPPKTTEQAFDVARWHLQWESFFFIYAYMVGAGMNINSPGKMMGVASAIYNTGTEMIEAADCRNHRERNARLRRLQREVGMMNVSAEMIQELFNRYPVRNLTSFGRALFEGKDEQTIGDQLGNFLAVNGRHVRGLIWRRWLEAGLISGDISHQDILNVPIGGMYEFWAMTSGRTKRGFINGDAPGTRTMERATYAEFLRWLENPVNRHGNCIANVPRVYSFLPDGKQNYALRDFEEEGTGRQRQLAHFMTFANMRN